METMPCIDLPGGGVITLGGSYSADSARTRDETIRKRTPSAEARNTLGAELLRRYYAVELANEVYAKTFNSTESFADFGVGTDLAYLLAAIIQPDGQGAVDWSKAVMDKPPRLCGILRRRFTSSHPVWGHIKL